MAPKPLRNVFKNKLFKILASGGDLERLEETLDQQLLSGIKKNEREALKDIKISISS